jgi:putative sterol carrier protein
VSEKKQVTNLDDVDIDALAKTWMEELNGNDIYKDVGKGWKDAVVFIITARPDVGVSRDVGVYLDLDNGTCKEAREATEADRKKTKFVLAVSPEVAKAVFDGKLDAEDALMLGKVKIERGSKSKLSAYAEASQEMFKAAHAAVDKLNIEFPDIPGDF